MEIEDILAQAKPLLPVLVIPSLAAALPLARALVNGGARVLEVTLRTESSLQALQAISSEFPELIVGAGSVLNPGQVTAAAQAGARFIVSPGLSHEVVRKARELALAVLPGVMTPSEIMTAQAAGLSCLKLFPAELAGGVNFLKAVAGPMAGIKFCPTGGIHPGNASEYLALPNVACIGGSWIAPADLIASESWQQIEQLTRQALQAR